VLQLEKASSHPHKKLIVKPIYKKWTKEEPNNYCPVTPSYFKDSGKSNSKSADFFFRQTQHSKSQFGFRKKKSTIDAIAAII
jgi:hypothetical protein